MDALTFVSAFGAAAFGATGGFFFGHNFDKALIGALVGAGLFVGAVFWHSPEELLSVSVLLGAATGTALGLVFGYHLKKR